jgi:hypothetical protein
MEPTNLQNQPRRRQALISIWSIQAGSSTRATRGATRGAGASSGAGCTTLSARLRGRIGPQSRVLPRRREMRRPINIRKRLKLGRRHHDIWLITNCGQLRWRNLTDRKWPGRTVNPNNRTQPRLGNQSRISIIADRKMKQQLQILTRHSVSNINAPGIIRPHKPAETPPRLLRPL